MNHVPVSLKEVDRVEIVTLIDNYVDVLLKDTDVVTRPQIDKGGEIHTDSFLAEHGLSILITVSKGEKTHTFLLDTGYTKVGVLHNMAQLGIAVRTIEAIVISHAHMDHTGSLFALLEEIPGSVPLIVHPDAFLSPRYIEQNDGKRQKFPRTLIREDLTRKGVNILESKGPVLIADDFAAVTGEVERTTEFEKGLPGALIERREKIERDPVRDDQSVVVKLKDKGLVVISGCSHAGIINTILYAQRITGLTKVHAILGGFHLSGPFFGSIIEKTIQEIKMIEPKVLLPMHCTGWDAVKRFSEEFPASFILNSVGSKITLSG